MDVGSYPEQLRPDGSTEHVATAPSDTPLFVAAGCRCETVQVVCNLRFSPPLSRQTLSSRIWGEKLTLRLGVPSQYSIPGAATQFSNTIYDPGSHPARSLLLGPRLTALLYPTGDVVVTATSHSEQTAVDAARAVVDITMQAGGGGGGEGGLYFTGMTACSYPLLGCGPSSHHI